MTQTKFKQTEVGKIPGGWEVLSISDVAGVVGGGTPSTKDVTNFGGDISWITPKDLSNYHFRYIERGERNITKKGLNNSSAKLLPKGAVLLTTRAPIGYVAIAKNQVTTNQGFRSLVPRKNVISEFLYYLLKMNTECLKSHASGTTFGELAGSTLKSLTFAFPPVPEQKSIAKILSDLDSKIELNQRMNQTLEAVGQALFKHWFIDFEFPNEEGKPYKSSGGEMMDSELGEIPEGWSVESIDKAMDFLNGLALQKYPAETDEDYLPVIKIRELKQGISENTDKASLSVPRKYIIEDGDVLFSWSGSLEVTIWCQGRGALNQHLFKVTSEKYPKWFYYYWVHHHLPRYRQIASGKATTMGHIQRHHLSETLIPVPTKEIVEKTGKVITPIFSKLINNDVQSQKLKHLRDTLLPKLMSGQIRVI
ncbi:MAG: restriction endonuclease subunit S [Candidatus Hodarchaeales archaeon]